MSAPKVTIARTGRRWSLRWSVDVWWDDGDDTGHGVGSWALTRWGAKREARALIREYGS